MFIRVSNTNKVSLSHAKRRRQTGRVCLRAVVTIQAREERRKEREREKERDCSLYRRKNRVFFLVRRYA